jgi:2-keto-4-pentenoate hydratase/2-oxohepta-3-ene-1,7-dioic acid hydratase in catechol pathway
MKKVILENKEMIPSKIVCVGRNYVEHILELENDMPDEMVVFLKPNSSITDVLQSNHFVPLQYEGELCFLYEYGKFSAIGFGLDLTKRDLQSKLKRNGLPWERAKAFNGSAVFSHFVGIPDSIQDITFQLDINGKTIQYGNIDLMIHKPADILNEVMSFIDLCDGDIIMTGTPKGVGPVRSGDLFQAKIKKTDNVIVNAEWIAQ